MKLVLCEVGMFRLPGLIVTDEGDRPLGEEKLIDLDIWATSEQGTGKRLTEKLWSFKNESQRDWFILRWSGND